MPVHSVRGVALLDEDPELGSALEPEELEEARRLLVVPVVVREVGPWDIGADLAEPSLGLLLLDGLVTVNVVLGDRVASQLAGPGDVLQLPAVPDSLLPVAVGHHVSEQAKLAVLDRRFIAGIRRWPALLLALHERQRVQERRQAVHSAIGKLRRVEDRILALLWHLAERWGRVTADGVVVPLALTHEMIGRLAGA
jgi:CRP/FNR family transcriptional regulator, cyclic AMP receptor protein